MYSHCLMETLKSSRNQLEHGKLQFEGLGLKGGWEVIFSDYLYAVETSLSCFLTLHYTYNYMTSSM